MERHFGHIWHPAAEVVKRLKDASLKIHKITIWFLNLFWLKFQGIKEFYGENIRKMKVSVSEADVEGFLSSGRLTSDSS